MNIGTLTGYINLEDQLSPALSLAQRNLQSFGSSMTGAGLALTAGITAPLTVAAAAAVSFSSTFKASMVRLVSIAGVLPHELADVKQHILDLAPAVGIGPQALAKAMTKVSSTVSDTKTALEILDIAAQGTKAGFGEVVDVAGALTTVVNSYGAANITAAEAANILAQAVKEGGAEARELAPTLANVVPFAAQLGVSFQEVAANIATMTKLGVPTAEAVTSLTSVFTALSRETSQGTEALAEMGLSYESIRKAIKEHGLAATLQELTTLFGGNVTVLTDVFGRIEAVKNIMGTAGVQGETYAKVLDVIKRSSDSAGGAMKDMADAMSGTQIQNWKELTAALQVAAIKLGDALAPAIARVTTALMPMAEMLIDVIDGFSKLPQPVQMTTFAILGIAAAVGPALASIGLMAQGVAALIPLFAAGTIAARAFGVAVTFMSGPLGWAVAATGLLTTGLLLWSSSADDAKDNTEELTETANRAVQEINSLTTATGNSGKAFFEQGESAKVAAEKVKKALEDQKAAADALLAISDRLFGSDDIKKAEDYVAAIGRIENVSRLSIAAQEEVAAVMMKGVEAMVAQGIATDELSSKFAAYGLAATETSRAITEELNKTAAAAKFAAEQTTLSWEAAIKAGLVTVVGEKPQSIYNNQMSQQSSGYKVPDIKFPAFGGGGGGTGAGLAFAGDYGRPSSLAQSGVVVFGPPAGSSAPGGGGAPTFNNTYNVNGTGQQVAQAVMAQMTEQAMMARIWPSQQ